MAKIIPITEHFQHFVEELKESFWGDLQGEAQRAAKKFFELLSERQRDRYMVSARYGRSAARKDHRNGYYLPGERGSAFYQSSCQRGKER